MAPKTPLLDTVRLPADLRALPQEQLQQLADELREETISAVSVTGGHLGAGLGVVELTVALHYVFDTPKDVLIWDVGHQAYPHKILTGRRDRIRTLRQGGGLSGFTKRAESEYDPFGAAHASTSISAALGFCAARDREGRDNKVVAGWNGLAVAALAEAGAVMGRTDYVDAAEDIATYLERVHWNAPDRLLTRVSHESVARGIGGLLGRDSSHLKKSALIASVQGTSICPGV